jgi:UDPglucose 6-dehydrogenase
MRAKFNTRITFVQVMRILINEGVGACARPPAPHHFPNEPRLTFAENQTGALEGADALIIVTEWREFRSPDFDNIKAKLKSPVIFDGRNLYDPVLVRGLGFEYLAIGR